MARRRKKNRCNRCDMVGAFEKLALKELNKKVPRADRLGHLLDLVEQAEGLDSCECGKQKIAGEDVGSFLDRVTRR